MAQIQFDWSINLGAMIQLVTLIVAMTVLYMKMSGRMADTERRVRTLFAWVHALIRATPGLNAEEIAKAANGQTKEGS